MSKGKAKDSKKKDGKPAGAKAADAPRTFIARVYVALKPAVNDPEGLTIAGALGSLGFDGVAGVRSGRYFEITLSAADARDAASQVDQMCARLLANPVIERYTFDLSKP